MFRYVAFVWESANPSDAEVVESLGRGLRGSASDWQEALTTAGLRVLVAGVRPGSIGFHRLQANGGVIVGTLFKHDRHPVDESTPAELAMDEDLSQRIVSTAGRHLVQSYWGRYAAFIRNPSAQTTHVVRDPTSNNSCFWTRYRGVLIFFSCVADCVRMGPLGFAVDWEFVKDRVAVGPEMIGRIGIKHVSEVERGECIDVKGLAISRQLYWDPVEISRTNVVEDEETAVRLLRSTMKSCARAWASCHESVLLRLSGGLDSSSVLGCLQNLPNRPAITCITYYIPGGHADERPWARLAATRAGCKHIEHARDFNVDLRDIQFAQPSLSPPDYFLHLELNPTEGRLAAERQATAILDGVGGDSLFGATARDLIGYDYLARHRVGSRFFRVAADAALLTNTSVWRVVGESLHKRWTRSQLHSSRSAVAPTRQLVSADLTNARGFAPLAHAWFKGAKTIPWVVMTQLAPLIASPTFYPPTLPPDAAHPEGLDLPHSQPIVELCLRIPLYLHSRFGRSRHLLRRAMTDTVPREILDRYWKDRAPGSLESLMERNRRVAREMLLDGTLVAQGLLDRKKVESVFTGLRVKQTAFTHEILDHVYVEGWLRGWVSEAGSRVAA